MNDLQVSLSKTLAFLAPVRTKRNFKEETNDFEPHKQMCASDMLPTVINSWQIINSLHNLELAIRAVEDVALENIRTKSVMSETVVDYSQSSTKKQCTCNTNRYKAL